MKQDVGLVTQTQSLALMRNFLRASVSSIAFLRQALPANCFQDNAVGGMALKRIDPRVTEEASRLNNWLEQGVCLVCVTAFSASFSNSTLWIYRADQSTNFAHSFSFFQVFDALEKKYLQTLLFQISVRKDSEKKRNSFKNDELVLFESFAFQFAYGEDGDASCTVEKNGMQSGRVLRGREDLKKYTSHVLRSILEVASCLGPLPEDKDRIVSFKVCSCYVTLLLGSYNE